MELPVLKWGNSAAVRLPSELLEILKVALGDKLAVDVRADGVFLKAKRPSFLLSDLVSQCDSTASDPADMAAWKGAKAVGREIW